MSQLFRRSQNARQREEGQGLVEYALILVMVAVVVIAVLSLMGPSVGNVYSQIVNVLRQTSSTYCQTDEIIGYDIYEIVDGARTLFGNELSNPGHPWCS